MMRVTLLLPLLAGCLTLPEEHSGQLMPALSKAIGVQERYIRMLSAGEWWQQTLGGRWRALGRMLHGGSVWVGDRTSVRSAD